MRSCIIHSRKVVSSHSECPTGLALRLRWKFLTFRALNLLPVTSVSTCSVYINISMQWFAWPPSLLSLQVWLVKSDPLIPGWGARLRQHIWQEMATQGLTRQDVFLFAIYHDKLDRPAIGNIGKIISLSSSGLGKIEWRDCVCGTSCVVCVSSEPTLSA